MARQGGIPSLNGKDRLILGEPPNHLTHPQPRLRSDPEFIGISVNHPISSKGCRPLGHARDPHRLGISFRWFLNQFQQTAIGVRLKNLWCGIHRTVIGHDEEINTLGEMVFEV